MANLKFHPEVYEEIQTAYSWYEDQAEGLGDNFISEVEAALESIKQLPVTWPKFGKNTHRYLLTKFPYAVVYKPTPSISYVVAVMHQSRKPGYWRDRT